MCSPLRRTSLIVIACVLTGLGLLAAAPASAQTATGFTNAPPSSVSFASTGCRNPGNVTLPDGGGFFICPDADYVAGNLGKSWNELDLVPFRLAISDKTHGSSAKETYNVIIAADFIDSGLAG